MTVKTLEYEFTHGESSWRLDIYSLTVDDWIELERQTELDGGVLLAKFVAGQSFAAKKAMYWMARRKAGEQITFDSPALNYVSRDFSLRLLKTSHEIDEVDGDEEGEPDPTAETTTKSSRSTKK